MHDLLWFVSGLNEMKSPLNLENSSFYWSGVNVADVINYSRVIV